jgi:hypothetical protein
VIPRRSRSATSSLRAISVVAAPSIADPSPPRRPIRRNRICGFTGIYISPQRLNYSSLMRFLDEKPGPI